MENDDQESTEPHNCKKQGKQLGQTRRCSDLRNHRHRWLGEGLADLLDCNVERSVRSRHGVCPREIASQGDEQRKRNQEFHGRYQPKPIAKSRMILSQHQRQQTRGDNEYC